MGEDRSILSHAVKNNLKEQKEKRMKSTKASPSNQMKPAIGIILLAILVLSSCGNSGDCSWVCCSMEGCEKHTGPCLCYDVCSCPECPDGTWEAECSVSTDYGFRYTRGR